ncbi:MAG: hypothetical protein NT030_06065 [Candidatus Saganbacteria bacterium]|nr:hypothetical protein [Candidatus Saganbacteria bacterium]
MKKHLNLIICVSIVLLSLFGLALLNGCGQGTVITPDGKGGVTQNIDLKAAFIA